MVASGLRSQGQECTKESAKGPELQAEKATSIYLQEEYVLVKCKLTVLGKERE